MSEIPTDRHSALEAALYRILRAVARLCLRHGFPHDALAELAKRAFVDVAYEEFPIPRRKQSASRVALLTGIHRKEIARMRAREDPATRTRAQVSQISWCSTVVGAWRRDDAFRGAQGQPLALEFEGSEHSFAELVRRYAGGDVPARAVLDELDRVGATERTRDDRIKLTAKGYIPVASSTAAITIFGTDVADLIAAIDHNLAPDQNPDGPAEGYFQRKVAYDNVSRENLETVMAVIRKHGTSAIERLDRAIAKYDRDSGVATAERTPRPAGGENRRHRAMVGIYCFAEPYPDADPGRKPLAPLAGALGEADENGE